MMGWTQQIKQPIPHDVGMLVNDKKFVFTSEITVPAASSVTILLETPSDVDVMIAFAEVKNANVECLVEGYSCAEVSAKGTQITTGIVNMRCREAETKQPKMKIYNAPTVTNSGTLMSLDVAKGDTQGSRVELANAGLAGAFILNRGSLDLLKITNRDSGAAASLTVKLVWIEDSI